MGAIEEKMGEAVQRPYTLRKLKDSDLFPLLGLLRKLGLSQLREVMAGAANGGNGEKIGADVLMGVFEVLISRLEGEAGEEVYRFYSGLSGIPAADLKEMEFGTLPLMIYDSITDMRNSSFFRVLAKLR